MAEVDATGTVQGLWIGDRLGAMQQCSIRSFLAAGHAYDLYTYGAVSGVPDGVRVRDAAALIPADKIWYYTGYDSPAGFSNQFRYHLLRERGGTWADLDVICLRRLPDTEYIVPAQNDPTDRIATCILRAPRDSVLLAMAVEATDNVDASTAVWGQTGPKLFTRLLAELDIEVLPTGTVCPIDFLDWHMVISANRDVQAETRDRISNSFAIHLWNEMWRRGGVDTNEPGPPGCLYAELLQRFGVVTTSADAI